MDSQVVNPKIGKSTAARYTIHVAMVHMLLAVHGGIRGFVVLNTQHIQDLEKKLDDFLTNESTDFPEASGTVLDQGLLLLLMFILIHLGLSLVLFAKNTNESMTCLQIWLVVEAISVAMDTFLVIIVGLDHGNHVVLGLLLVRPFCFYVVCRRIQDIKMSSKQDEDTVNILPSDSDMA